MRFIVGRKRRSRGAADLLFRLLRTDPGDVSAPIADLGADGLATLLALADWHRMTPGLWGAFGPARAVLPPEVAAFLEAVSHFNGRRNDALRAQALEIAAATAGAAPEGVFLKGTAFLFDGLYPDPATRFLADIDLLVAPERLPAAAEALVAAGYRRLPDPVAYAHDLVRLVRDGRPAMIELHRAPVALPLAPALGVAEVLRRAVPLPGTAIRIPCPEDLAAHALAHGLLQDHGFRLAEMPLRAALDLRLLAERHGAALDWDTVAARLSRVADGADAYAFGLLAVREALATDAVPAPAASRRAARRLAVWRRRAAAPALPLESGLAFLGAYARDCAWRLRHAPEARRHLLGRALSPAAYPAIVRSLLDIAAYGPPAMPRDAAERPR